MKTIGLVPIRGGSKGLPGKNIRPFAGRPLYLHAVDQALRTAGACVISTDIEEIWDAPLPPSCRLVRRSAELAADDTPMNAVIEDVIARLDLVDERLLLLQATSPLRLDSDVEAALALHAAGGHELVMTVTDANAGILKYGTLEGDSFVPVGPPEYCFANRQSLPRVYRPNGAVYVFGVGAFRKRRRLPSESIGAVNMPEDRSFDIDTIADFEAAERIHLASGRCG